MNRRRLMSFILSITMFLGIFVGFGEVGFADSTRTINIIHTNDIHSRVQGDDKEIIGFPKLATKIKDIKKNNPNTLVLDAGDTLHGMPIINMTDGRAMIELMNELGYDAMVPGNHDYNYGYDRLVELSKLAKFPVLAGNVVREDGSKDFEDYIIKDMDGFKLGIFGLSTEESKYKSSPINTKGVDITSTLDKAKEMVAKLEEEKVDMIIALAHIGVDDESDPTTTKIAREVKGIDLIIDGHSHTLLEEGKVVDDTLIVQTGSYLNNIGLVEIEVRDNKLVSKRGSLISYEDSKDLKEDAKVSSMIESLEKDNEKILSQVIGKTVNKLEGTREIVRAGETNLGNLIADALRESTDADISFTNGGGIRASIEEGEISKGDVLQAFPFTNYVEVLKLKGIDILKALEHGVRVYPEPVGGFPHVSGMTYKIDKSKTEGNRVHGVKIGGKDIDLNKEYKVAMPDILAAGGDAYTMFESAESIGSHPLMSDILMAYIGEKKVIDMKVEGRVIEEEKKELVVNPEPKPEVSKEKTYIVKKGDVLYRIGLKFNRPWKSIAKRNNIKNGHRIYPGQKLIIPSK